MGGAGLPGLIFAVVLLVLIAALVLLVYPWVNSRRSEVERLADPSVEKLEYEVPEGQDPAAVVKALKHDGLDAIAELRHGRQLVLINATEGVERVRPRARAVIAQRALLNTQGDPAPEHEVRFLDE
ncbi:MAG: hypothetical protein M3237_18670 [Actinomycetota bacterium]|nr:hypothetical protein [Actinomycetota bacterium]